jgi:Flp pilus assembly CpaF family ATPase
MFRLPRKLERQSLNHGGPRRRYIVAINPVASVPVRCITVDSPSSLFLAGRACIATHNTTMVRALCGELDPWERIGTFETEYELGLHEMPHRHRRIVPWEARPGSGERGLNGRSAGEITLDDLLYDSFRFNLQRYIIGEIRGREILALIKAVQSGEGSISTTHAANARAAVDKLVTCALEAGAHITEAYATRAVTEHIDLIVHLTLETQPGHDDHTARRTRYVSEIYAVEPGENGRGGTHIFRPSPTTGRAEPHVLPDPYRSLERFGFRLNDFHRETTR